MDFATSMLFSADCKLYPYIGHLPLGHSGGIQFAAAQLPHLQLFDCGMTICDPSVENPSIEENESPADNSSQELKYQQKVANTKLYPMYQKLIIKHGRLKKLSLWGCSGLDVRLRRKMLFCFRVQIVLSIYNGFYIGKQLLPVLLRIWWCIRDIWNYIWKIMFCEMLYICLYCFRSFSY